MHAAAPTQVAITVAWDIDLRRDGRSGTPVRQPSGAESLTTHCRAQPGAGSTASLETTTLIEQ